MANAKTRSMRVFFIRRTPNSFVSHGELADQIQGPLAREEAQQGTHPLKLVFVFDSDCRRSPSTPSKSGDGDIANFDIHSCPGPRLLDGHLNVRFCCRRIVYHGPTSSLSASVRKDLVEVPRSGELDDPKKKEQENGNDQCKLHQSLPLVPRFPGKNSSDVNSHTEPPMAMGANQVARAPAAMATP